jgi:hypothetical protein
LCLRSESIHHFNAVNAFILLGKWTSLGPHYFVFKNKLFPEEGRLTREDEYDEEEYDDE